MSKNIDSELCKRALAIALALRGRHKGLVFHSDRGGQYSSRAYKSMLAENGIESSMSEPGFRNQIDAQLIRVARLLFCKEKTCIS